MINEAPLRPPAQVLASAPIFHPEHPHSLCLPEHPPSLCLPERSSCFANAKQLQSRRTPCPLASATGVARNFLLDVKFVEGALICRTDMNHKVAQIGGNLPTCYPSGSCLAWLPPAMGRMPKMNSVGRTLLSDAFGLHSEAVADCSSAAGSASGGRERTILTVSRLTLTTCPIKRRMYVGSSARFGSLVMPLRLSVETWY